MDKSEPIWQPSSERIAQANITRYMDQLNQQGLSLDGYPHCINGLLSNQNVSGSKRGSFVV
ncbi:hypothetical protein [Vibrio pelagius]|uniref:hypothetical protein n=1 Tax=Vibrio pelagius TaxID=28169 RepID=UPI003B846F0A